MSSAPKSIRARWGTPSDKEAIAYSASEFRVGGCDVYRCGLKHDMKYTGSVRYEDIVPNHALSFSETVRLEDTTLGISLITWELWPERNGAKLVVTDQLVSLDGADMVKGTRAGMNGALDNLGQWLALGAVTP